MRRRKVSRSVLPARYRLPRRWLAGCAQTRTDQASRCRKQRLFTEARVGLRMSTRSLFASGGWSLAASTSERAPDRHSQQ